MQLAPAANGAAVLQVPLRLKSAAAVPLSVSPVNTSVAVPLLVTVTDCVAPAVPTTCEPKARLLVLRASVGVGARLPVPLSATVVGEFAALWTMPRVALRAPAAAGVKVTGSVQELLAATLPPAPQLPPAARANSLALLPVMLRLLSTSGAVPVLLSVSVRLGLVLPTVVAARLSAVLETAAAGLVVAVAVPLRAMTTGVRVLLWVRLSVPVRVPAAVGV